MRKVNELIIRGEPPEVARVVERIEAAPRNGWSPKPHPVMTAFGRSWWRYDFATQGGPNWPAATLSLAKRRPDELYVSTIVPAARRVLSEEEYNRILDLFARDYLKTAVENLDVEVELHPFRVKMEDILEAGAYRKLKQFVEAADKSNPTPLDRLRWSRFVAQCHIDDSDFELDELDWWLRDSEWSEDQSRQLIEWYAEGRSLLKEYDEERVG